MCADKEAVETIIWREKIVVINWDKNTVRKERSRREIIVYLKVTNEI
jgi:hypothetical protein